MKLVEMTGRRYGRLTVIERAENTPGGTARWRCKCDCGKETVVVGSYLRNGSIKSCGCYMRENNGRLSLKHGGYKTKLYHVWVQMRSRCRSPKDKNYPYYGGRGISVCDEWQDFRSFQEWALSNGYREGLTIDRIDNDGDYKPTNCRWVTMAVQAKNKRKINKS